LAGNTKLDSLVEVEVAEMIAELKAENARNDMSVTYDVRLSVVLSWLAGGVPRALEKNQQHHKR
jgi:hypothetical protein